MPTTTAWYLADVGEARGKQDLFTRQYPQVLKAQRAAGRVECLGRGRNAQWQRAVAATTAPGR